MRKKGEYVLNGRTPVIKTGCGNMYVTTNANTDGELAEVFCSLGKSGGCARHWTELIGRVISALIRPDSDIDDLIKTMKGIKCGIAADDNHSCSDAIATALETFIKFKEKEGIDNA